jgi:hypothetical protein
MTLKDIADVVSNALEIDVRKRSRQREFVNARAVYYKIARDSTPFSLARMSRELGQDHASAIHYLNNIFPTLELYEKDTYKRYLALDRLAHRIHNKELDKIDVVVDNEHEKMLYEANRDKIRELSYKNEKLDSEIDDMNNVLRHSGELLRIMKGVMFFNHDRFLKRVREIAQEL